MLTPEVRQPRPLLFKTPQELIHIRHGISLLQYKYWLLMLKAYREEYERDGPIPEGEMCFLARARLETVFGYQPRTKDIEDDLEELRKEAITFNVLEKDNSPARMGTGFINQWFVSGARVGVMFPPAIKRAVEDLDDKSSIFQLLNWQIFNSFSGKYEAIIYKLCKDYLGVGLTPIIAIEKFREYIGLDPAEYAEFKALNRYAISGPIEKINNSELADITIKVEFKRSQKKVVGLQFLVTKKQQQLLDFGDDPCFSFAKTPIPRTLQLQYLDGRSPKDIEASILRANVYGEDQEKNGRSVNYSALYRRAIEENWGQEQLNIEAQKVIDEEERSKEQDAKQEASSEQELNKRQSDFMSFQTTRAVNEMPMEQRKRLAKKFIKKNGAYQLNEETGWFDDKLANVNFKIFLRKEISIEFNEQAFKEWVKSTASTSK